MLKIYEYGGFTYQFEEGKQPKGAVEVKAKKVSNKAKQPKNKEAANPVKDEEDV